MKNILIKKEVINMDDEEYEESEDSDLFDDDFEDDLD